MSNYGGIHWDDTNLIYEISGGNIKVKDTIYFKDSSRSFNGTYDTLSNKPTLTQGTKGETGVEALSLGGASFLYTTNFGFGEGPVFRQGDFAGYIANGNFGTGTYKKEEIDKFQFSPWAYNPARKIGIGPTYDEHETGWFRLFQVGDKIEFTSTSNSLDKVTYRVAEKAMWKDSTYSDYVELRVEYISYSGSDSFIADQEYQVTFPLPVDGTNGSQGAKGETGSAGSNGSQGAKGETGSAGSNGSQGTKGETGSAGSNGSQGAKGETGSAGSNGSQGAKGDTGSSGGKGSQGIQGPAGEGGGGGGIIFQGQLITGTLSSIVWNWKSSTLDFITEEGLKESVPLGGIEGGR